MARKVLAGTLALLTIYLFGCAAGPSARPKPLIPSGPHADSPPIVRYVFPGSPADQYLKPGDRLIAVDGREVASTYGFYGMLNAGAKTFTVERQSGETISIPARSVISVTDKGAETWALLFGMGETIVFDQMVPAYDDSQTAGLFYLDESTGLVTASVWDTEPRFLELFVEIRVPESCFDCRLNNIAVMDWDRKSWLAPVDPAVVALSLFPSFGQAPSPISVPPPTPTGYAATTTGSGQLSGYVQGQHFSGTYTGSAITAVTPYYDYTLTNMAHAYNLGAALRQSKIQADTAAREDFVLDRYSNLRLGEFVPGERTTGYVQFAVPNDFQGPFVVAFQGKSLAIVRFEMSQ